MKALQPKLALLAAVLVGSCAAVSPVLAQNYRVSELSAPDRGDAVARGLNNVGSAAGRSGTNFVTQTVAIVSRGASRFEVLGTLPRGDYSSAFGINDLDQVVGASNGATSVQAFLWEPGRGMRALGTLPGDNASQAFAINNRGEVVGYSSGPGGIRPFLWNRNEGMQYLGTLGGQAGVALGISNAGYVVGRSQGPTGDRAFFWSSNGGMVDLGALSGHTLSQAMGVNDGATVVGFSGTDLVSQPVVWPSAAKIVPLPLLAGGDVGRALGVNNAGQIVGFSTAPGHAYRAVIWSADGRVRDLNAAIPSTAGVLLAEAQAINDRGQILAYGFRLPIDHDLHENPGRMFLLTPF